MNRMTRYAHLALLTAAMGSIGAAQNPGATASDPRPEDATRAILEAFDSFRIVALGDRHGMSLIRHPGFAAAANDIVVECVNSLFQPVLDRYIAGEDVPEADVRRLWRDQTHPPCSVDDFHGQLFQLVRRINQRLPSSRRLRVLAGEPPIDWNTVSPEKHNEFLSLRDVHAAGVIEREVLAKNRKALVLYGLGHLYLGVKQQAVGRYEERNPGVTFVIAPYVGGSEGARCGLPAVASGVALDPTMASWPVPSLARTKGTWLADFARVELLRPALVALFGESSAAPVDAYLYLGPPGLLLTAQPSASAFADADFIAELQRRGTVMAGGNFRDSRIEPDKVREREMSVFACEQTLSR